MTYLDARIDPRTFSIVASLLRMSIASATQHLDLKEHDKFYERLKVQLAHWQQEGLELPAEWRLDHGESISAQRMLHVLEVFLAPLPPDYLVEVGLSDS